MKYLKHVITIAAVLFVVVGVSTVHAANPLTTTSGSTSANVYGYAWSHNTGWIKMNNCDLTAANTSVCSGTNYGVAIDPQSGAVSGYGWSSNIGWIDFDATSCGTPAVVSWAVDGSGTWSGYARAIAASGTNSGGWDGCIRMSGPITGGGNYGVTIGSNGQFSGYAWNANTTSGGSVGDSWISFALVRYLVAAPAVQLSVDSWVGGACSSATNNPLTLAWEVTNVVANSCQFSITPSALVHSQTQTGTTLFAMPRTGSQVIQLQCTGLNNQPVSSTTTIACNACSDGIDNDGDGFTDAGDSRCNCSGSYNAAGTTERGSCTTEVLGNRGNPIYEER